MKNLILLLFLIFFSAENYSQSEQKHSTKKGELNLETNTGKLFQGAFTGAFTYLTVQQFTKESDTEWLKIPISILSAYVYEVAFNSKTNSEKQLFAVAGAVSVSVTFEIFKSKRRK